MKRVLRAYTDDRPFSVDLVGAVIRQCSFIDKMHQLKWTTPGYFDSPEDKDVLVHAIIRYHAYVCPLYFFTYGIGPDFDCL